MVRAPRVMHGKTSQIFHDGKGLFHGLPNPFEATRYHSLVIEKTSVPPDLEVTARTADEEIMAVRHRTLPVEGVQFHPESFLTTCRQGPAAQLRHPGRAAVNVREALARVVDRQDLTAGEMAEVVGSIMDGQATPAQIGGLLVGLRMKGETVDEIVGAARAMRQRMVGVDGGDSILVDTCGTGGDGSRSINVSTLAAFVVAGAGVVVAKHGNRAQSSQSGSHDVLEALGLDPAPGPETAARCLREAKLAFLFAPAHHAATKHAVGPRKEVGVRTLFNLLGPLDQPVRRALSRERHLQPRALRAAGPGPRGAGVVARHGRPRRRWPGRVRAGRRDVRRRADRRQGARLRAEALRLRPGRERSGRLARRRCRPTTRGSRWTCSAVPARRPPATRR